MTILGHHSVAELRDWLAALEYELREVVNAYVAFAPIWKGLDAAAHADWFADWSSFHERYDRAHARARGAIARAQLELGVPDSVIPVEDEWQGLVHALAKTPGTTAKGDLQDLYNRLCAAQGKPIDLSRTPQPTATDADLGVFKAADSAIKAGEAVAHRVAPSKGGTLLIVGLGLGLGLVFAAKTVLR